MLNAKEQAVYMAMASTTLLLLLKIAAGILSGSAGMISEMIHSATDLFVSILTFISIRVVASSPAQIYLQRDNHRESIFGLAEGIIILLSAGMILMEAIQRLIHPVAIAQAFAAVLVMLFSALINAVASSILTKTAERENSLAIKAYALDMRTDVYTSIGVGLGILLTKITSCYLIDSLIAILVAAMIIFNAWSLVQEAYGTLMSARLPGDNDTVDIASDLTIGAAKQAIIFQGD